MTMMCAVCMYDGRRQEYLIDLKDGQIDQLRTERDAALALLRRIYARDLIGWSDPLSKEVYELLRRKQ